ncbi:hypothetical protein [Porphyromonas pogonae]|uniref:hypothetical protein n=1 Tax=Porphyromonas pogonae TaxID=867595 RepID=UPI002E7AAA12|nr:hypothetical protein [Porphyromonas pogonae]
MKTWKTFISLIFISIALAGCTKGPEKVVKNFSESIAKGKYEEAKKYCTDRTATGIDLAASLGVKDLNPNFQFKKIKDSINGNEAWVIYTDAKGKNQTDTVTTHVVKIDGKWLVDESVRK